MKSFTWRNKRNYIISLIAALFCLSYVSAYSPVDQHINSNISQQCQETKNLAHYVGQSISYWIFVKDGNSYNWYLNNHPTANWQPIPDTTENMPYISKIYVWNPYGSISSSPTAVEANQLIPNFMYISNVKPAGVSKVKFARQFAAMYINTWWLTRTDVSAQINAQISKQQISSTTPQTPSSYRWFDENNVVHLWNYKINSAFNPSTKDTICMNFYIATCGDWIIDNPEKTWPNNTDGKQGIQTSQWFIAWVNTWFVPEICDSNTETGAACVNGTQGCCNNTCSWFGWWFCGDGIVQEELFEQCDDGDFNTSDINQWECNLDCTELTPDPVLPPIIG